MKERLDKKQDEFIEKAAEKIAVLFIEQILFHKKGRGKVEQNKSFKKNEFKKEHLR